MQMYAQPLIPNMHYIHPLSIFQQDSLRHQATQIVAMRLNRVEPPLRKESVEYMLDVDSTMWTLRKSKTNYCRLIEVLSCVASFVSGSITFAAGLDHFTQYKSRPRHPPHMNIKLSYGDRLMSDELDEEFNSFPRGKDPELGILAGPTCDCYVFDVLFRVGILAGLMYSSGDVYR
ncbi:FT-interacting protein 1-like protein [Tanacetum coccineum]